MLDNLSRLTRRERHGGESNRDYYLRRAQEEYVAAEGLTSPDARARHRELAKLLLSIAGDHDPGSMPPGIDRATVTSLSPGLIVLPGTPRD